jgi:hypothetical protein
MMRRKMITPHAMRGDRRQTFNPDDETMAVRPGRVR